MKPLFKAILAAEFLAFTLLLALCVPEHLLFQEKCQLFLWTGAYFKDVCSVPGGLADLIGRFFTQFFLNPWGAAAIVAALLVLFQVLLLRLRKDASISFLAITLLPAAVLCAFYSNENSMLSAVVALDLSLLAALGISAVERPLPRRVLSAVLTGLLYFAVGPLCLVFLFAVSVSDKVSALAGLPVLALSILASCFLFQYPMASLLGGIHYYRFLQTVRPEPWYALAAASLLLVLSPLFSGKTKPLANGLIIAASVSLSVILLKPVFSRDRSLQKEEVLDYALLAMEQDWDGIIGAAAERMPSKSPVSVACLNLALAQKGLLQEKLFHTFQNGPQGLISDSKVDFITPLAMAQVYWAVGLVDSAQRLVYEAQESIPDYQKSAYCYQWLVRTNLANGDGAVADKYLGALRHTLFYRDWAPSDDLKLIEERRLDDPSMVSSDENIRGVLSTLVSKNPANTMAVQYLLAYDMLSLDLDAFVEDYQNVYGFSAPESQVYAEALALAWARGHRNFDGIPWALPEGIAEKCFSFFSDRAANLSKSKMKSQYGNTFWHYYFNQGK